MSSTVSLTPPESVDAVVALSGSKSFTNRALILASIAEGKSVLSNASNSDDTKILIEGLRKFSIDITQNGSEVIVEGGKRKPYNGIIDIGPAGTCMRYLTSFAAGVANSLVDLRGSERMHQRPVKDLVEALQEVGVGIKYLKNEGCPPIIIKGLPKQTAYSFNLAGNISSQYLTSIMLSAPMLASYVEIFIKGDLVSKSYVDMTIHSLKQFNVNVIHEGYDYFLIAKTDPVAGNYLMDGDSSGAGYFWALALAAKGKIRINNLDIDSPQGDLGLLEVFKKAGATIDSGKDSETNWIEVSCSEDLSPIECNMELMPDSAQTLAVLCAMIKGKSTLTGLSTLRHKETDRIEATKTELAKVGIECETTDESIIIHGGDIKIPEGGVDIDTYEDHRMAMSFAVLAAKHDGIRINESEVVSKSFPDFWTKLESCGVGVL